MFKQIYQRKIGIGEFFSWGYEIYSRNSAAIIAVILFIYIPVNIILYLVNRVNTSAEGAKLFLDSVKLLEGLCGVIASMGTAAVVERAVFSDEGGGIGWQEALNKAFSRWGSCIGTSILAGFIIVGLALLLIIPGVIWGVYYAFIIQAVVLKGLSGKEALDYSKSLVKGQWWKVFGTLFAFSSVSIIFSIAIGIIASHLPSIAGIFTDTLADLVGAYFTILSTLYFINIDSLKNRKVELNSIEPSVNEA